MASYKITKNIHVNASYWDLCMSLARELKCHNRQGHPSISALISYLGDKVANDGVAAIARRLEGDE